MARQNSTTLMLYYAMLCYMYVIRIVVKRLSQRTIQRRSQR